jgi:head-tail adaptor
MRAGNYPHRVVIDTPVDTQDATTGEPVRSWVTLATVWAKMVPLSGAKAIEQVLSGALMGLSYTKIYFRWSPNLVQLGPKHRISHTVNDVTTIFSIISVADLMLESREIETLCKTGSNDG